MTEKRMREKAGIRSESERYYIDGNTARQLSTESNIRRKRDEQPVQLIQPEIRHEKRVSAFDLKYTLFLVASIIITLGSCLLYIYSNSQLTSASQSVAALQTELQTIQEQNNSMEESMNTTIDLNQIYQIATGRLGMVYASEDQVIYYNSSNSDSVHQYESIPGKR